jgi:hypothetical protein
VNGQEFRPYRYQGDSQDLEQPWPDERCGTYAGLNEHRRLREPACEPCLQAGREYVQQWRLRTGRVKSIRVKVTPQLLALLRQSSPPESPRAAAAGD